MTSFIVNLNTPANLIYNSELFREYLMKFSSEVKANVAVSDDKKLVGFQPNEFDVTCGRGKGCYNKSGNKLFRTIIARHLDDYETSKAKSDKGLIIARIINEIRSQNTGNTRFLKYNKGTESWYEMTPDQVREKVGHTIREAVATRIKNKESHHNEKRKIEKAGREAFINMVLQSETPLVDNCRKNGSEKKQKTK